MVLTSTNYKAVRAQVAPHARTSPQHHLLKKGRVMANSQPIPANRQFQDITGQKFHRLTVISFAGRPKKRSMWNCVCDCGATRVVCISDLRRGAVKSCGCWSREIAAQRLRIHGMKGTPIYNCWKGINERTSNPNTRCFKNYGGRGITVCDRWKDFANFLADMGPTYQAGLTIERINVNGNYEPSNCCWATPAQQARNKRNNRRITVDGVTRTLVEWAKHSGLPSDVIRHRLNVGWPVAKAVTEPSGECNKPGNRREHMRAIAKKKTKASLFE